jgi:apolipoprotein D and lipocalin family protein
MRFVWPIKAEYLITHLTQDYSLTVIGRNKRDYVWIMARTPQISDDNYQQLVQELSRQGYDISKLRITPHKWPEGNGRER